MTSLFVSRQRLANGSKYGDLTVLALREERRDGRGLFVRLAQLTALISAAVAAGGLMGTIRVNYTRSLPIGVYRTVRAGSAARGSIVLVCLPEAIARYALERGYVWRGACPGRTAPIGKLVLAIEGDTVVVTKAGLRLNGQLVPHTQPVETDSEGRAVSHYPVGVYLVTRNEVWLYSPYHRRSFDSRYFGPVPASSLRSRMMPLWTTESN